MSPGKGVSQVIQQPRNVSVPETVSLRQLNRATLARQMLVGRSRLSPVEAIEGLSGLQAQHWLSPYVGLWTRLSSFHRDAMTRAIEKFEVAKATLMRGTLHLVSARDYYHYDTAVSEQRFNTWLRVAGARDVVPEVRELHKRTIEYASKTPRSMDEMIEFTQRNAPARGKWTPRYPVWNLVSSLGGFIRAPPSGTWGHSPSGDFLAATSRIKSERRPAREEAFTLVLGRYLAAFGPASREDLVKWSGIQISRFKSAIEAMKSELISLKDGSSHRLLDVVEGIRPPADAPVPVRFLPKWDGVLLGYSTSTRDRVLPRKYYGKVIKVNGDVLATVLVDGFVVGIWNHTRKKGVAQLRVELFEKVAAGSKSAIAGEGSDLIRFIEPEAEEHEVVILE